MKTTDNLKKEKMKNKLLKLHDETLLWLNELEFMQDEHIFLEHLLSSHFLDLSTEKLYDPTRKLIKKLKEVEKWNAELVDSIHVHNKHMATWIESLHTNGKKSLTKEHNQIKSDFETYTINFKYVKKKIFSMIKEIMREHKQKLLLNK